jgi:hypothetical protein
MVERFDVTTTKKWKLDARGRLIVEATPTRSGIFKYIYPDGSTVRELRHPDDVFSKETMDSLEVIPYTIQENHTSLMTPEDVREKTYGTTMAGAKRIDNLAKIDIKINDGKEIKAVMKGESLELSNGYTCDVIKESGTFDGEEYDVRQKNIIYDHVARVKKARGGGDCRIRLDSADSAICGIEAERLDSSGETKNHPTGESMGEPTKVIQRELPSRESGEFKLDAQDIEIDESNKGVIDTFVARENKLFTALATANTSLVEQSVKMDKMESENKALIKSAENSVPSEKMDQEIEKRTNLYAMAEEAKIKDYKNLSIKDLSKQIVEQSGLFNKEKLDSVEYVDFAIEHMQEDHTKKVLKSRKNLTLHKGIKFDDGNKGESALEQAQ